jgi:two-component system, cell cycle response regulator
VVNGELSTPSIRATNAAAPAGAERPNRRELCRTITQAVEAPNKGRQRELMVRLDSANAGEVWTLNREEFSIGRHPDNQICIDDQGLSRQHVRIRRAGGAVLVEDLNSSNGTFVNGERITSRRLQNGDTVQLGPRICFRFTIAGEHEERVLKQLYESSVRDALTQAYNRHYFAGQLGAELSYALRHGADLSLIMLDVDHFKKVNDTRGHLAGDLVLKAMANLLGAQLRREDIFARYGGEEFAVILRGVAISGASVLAERLRVAAEQLPLVFDHQQFGITVSLGCASLACCNRHDPESLIQRADGRLYQAKRDGRNRVVWKD